MSSVAKRRVNFVVEITFSKSTIEEMSREHLLSCFIKVLKDTTVHRRVVDDIWIMGVAQITEDEHASYRWFMTDSEFSPDENTVPPKGTTN